MNWSGPTDQLLSTGSFGDGAMLSRDLDTWLLGLTVADSYSRTPQLNQAGLTSASSTELRCVFENWPPSDDPRSSQTQPALECALIGLGTEASVARISATSVESRTVRLAYAETEFGTFSPRSVDPWNVDAVCRAIALLVRALPQVCSNTIGLAPRLVKIADIVPSMHLSGSPGFVYVSERVLEGETWVLADALLHESLHEKSNLLRKFRGLLRASYREANSATTFLPWSVEYGEERHFSTWRLLSAGHVYVHLYALRRALGLQREARVPRERALFMLNALEQRQHHTDLDNDGRQLLAWLGKAIDIIPKETES